MRKLSVIIGFLCVPFLAASSPGIILAADTCNFAVGQGVWTAFGCINTSNPSELINKIVTISTGIGGGIAFLLILFGGFQILTSAGNPEQLSAGRELISSAITGLLLIILSIFLLKLIGVNVLGIPGFV